MLDQYITGSAQARCPHCGTSNALTAISLPSEAAVECSSCHVVLGSWKSLVAGTGEVVDDRAARTAPT